MVLYSKNFIIFFIIFPILTGLIFSPIFLAEQNAQADVTQTSVTVEIEFIVQETVSGEIEPTEQGEVELTTETGAAASVSFPADAVDTSADVSISSINETDVVSYAPIPSDLNVVSDLVYNFKAVAGGETLTTFEQLVTLTFTYTNAQISGLDESSLRVYYWDETTDEWVILSNYTLDAANNTIIATTTHFTLFAIMTSSVCGNNSREGSEQCDGSDLAGETCVSRGYASGALSCNTNCTFNVSNCSSGGGGGGGGGGGYVAPTTKVIIKGKAYPLSSITVLQDGKVATTTIADSLANFKVEITDITAGTWTFGVWGEDEDGRKSITFSFTTSVTRGMTTTIAGIFLPPSINLSKTALKRGETLNILGQTAPESDISIFVNSSEIIKKTKAEADGTWFYAFDTAVLDDGAHTARAKACCNSLLSTFSNTLAFNIGKGVIATIKKADITNDNKVNLVDFSILLYNWGAPKNLAADLNADGKVNLTDFSILLYHWTG